MSPNLYEQLQGSLGASYRLERELGGGGMSRVFLAHETALGRKVVVKVLLPELAAGVSIDRFRREIQLAAQLQHPHIVPLLAAGESEGLPYFTMPFITGESLRARLVRLGELPVIESVRILRDVVSALAYAHASGITHRDVKPDNILLTGGVAVVTDFGVAKAVSASSSASSGSPTSGGVAIGTPAYMAPEQAAGDPHVDHRADIYALGATAYEMLAGRTPFSGRTVAAMLAAQVVETPEPIDRLRPAVPPTLAALVMQCLAKHPADRPQSATDVMHVLDTISTPGTGTASTAAVVPPRRRRPGPARRSGVGAAAGAVAVAVLLAAGGVLWWRGASRPAAPVADAASLRPAPVRPSPVETVREPAVQDTAPAPTKPKTRRRPIDEAPVVAPNPPRPATRESVPAQPAPAAVPPGDTAPAPAPSPAPTVSAPPPKPQPAPEPPPDPRPEIQSVLAAYAGAVESQNVDNIRRAYPGMTAAQQRGWEQFFQTVRDVKAQLSVAQLDVTDGTAEAQLTGSYTYLNSSTRETERQPVAFHATLQRGPSGWRISAIR